jgi:hypothetical protein
MWHRIWHGHWPLYRIIPVGDYLARRSCLRCLLAEEDE